MLETLFVVGFVLLPLALAVVLILYRARFVVLGLAGVVTFLMVIWMVLKTSDIVERAFDPRLPAQSMPGNCATPGQTGTDDCRL